VGTGGKDEKTKAETFGLSTKSQASNSKQFPMTQIINFNQNRFGHLELELGSYLGFVIWKLGSNMTELICFPWLIGDEEDWLCC
jgi:hypothetical protein